MELEGQSGDAGHQRFDFAQFGKVEVLSTGALRIPAVLGRVGVFNYIKDGKTVRELRPPDEVFRADSMETLSGATATDMHPPRDKAWITPDNWKEHAVGYVDGSNLRRDGDLLRGTVVVQDAEMIRMIQAGERKELSPGYKPLNLDATPGRYNAATGNYGPDVTTGVEYDVVQRDIFYNSMGIGPRGWGRQGSAVALRLDSVHGGAHAMASHRDNQLGDFLTSKMKQLGKTAAELAVETGIIAPKEPEASPLQRRGPQPNRAHLLESILDGWTNRPSDAQLKALGKALDTPLEDLMRLIPDDLQRLDGGANLNTEASKSMDTIDTTDLHLDGLTAVLVPKPAAEIISKAIADRDAKIKALTDAASASEARLDGVTEQLATATKSLTELPGQMKTEIAARAKLEGQALTVLGADVKLDGKTDRQVQELALQGIAKAAGKSELTLDAKDDTYVAVRFDVAMEGFKPADATARATAAITGGSKPAMTLDSKDEPDPAKAREEMIARQGAASKLKAV